MDLLHDLLQRSAARHQHLCPRQVLGVRAGLAGCEFFAAPAPQTDKRLLAIVETDGCFADGIEVAAGVSVGHRTLRLEDLGKAALTLVDTSSEQAIRISPRLDIRQAAWEYAPGETRHYFAMLHAYQVMPVEALFVLQPVRLHRPVREIISRPGVRADCSLCGEEIINEREIIRDDQVLCKTCAGQTYYDVLYDPRSAARPTRVELHPSNPDAAAHHIP